MNISPFQTTNAAGTFSLSSEGYIQGMAMDDPAVRNQLAGGVVASGENPMFGGLPIYEFVPVTGTNGSPSRALGGNIGRATATASGAKPITGFTVFNQAHHGVSSPSSPVPQYDAGMSVHFYRLGSGARIPVACDPALVDLQGELITTAVGWDFTNQLLVATSSGDVVPCRVLDVKTTNCMIVAGPDGSGNFTWNRNGCCALIVI